MPRHHRVACGSGPAALSRRDFFALAAAGAVAACGGGSSTPTSPSTVTGRLSARPQVQRTTLSPGPHVLGGDAGRDDGIIYVPHGVDPDEALPFAVMLHDAAFLDGALAQAFSSCAIDPARVTLGGLSDGATYALALGLLNGDLFTQLVAFSPGFLKSVDRHGKPRVFISHGTRDVVLNINSGGRGIAQQLTTEGYDVTYREFDGGHVVPDAIAREAFAWLS